MFAKNAIKNQNIIDESKNTTFADQSSYNLKSISFEDSQVDHFIPYVSPFILAINSKINKKPVLNQLNRTNQNESEIERMRGNLTNQATPSLIQYPSENTINLANPINNYSIKKTDHSVQDFAITNNNSKIIEINQDETIKMDKTIIHVERSTISPRKLEEKLKVLSINAYQNTADSSNVLTNVTVDTQISQSRYSSQNKSKLQDQVSNRNSLESNLSSYSKKSLLSNYVKTPAGNVLGSDHRAKNNLFASIDISNDSSYVLNSNSSNSNDMATSPLKFITLSPSSHSNSNTTKLFSEQSSINNNTTISSLNTTHRSRLSLVRVSPELPNNIETRLEYSKLTESSDSKISNFSTSSRKLKQEDKNWIKLADNFASKKSNSSHSLSDYFESDTEYLNPVSDKLHLLIKSSIEKSKNLSAQFSIQTLREKPVKVLVENTKCLNSNLNQKDTAKNRTNENIYNKENQSSEASTQTSFLIQTTTTNNNNNCKRNSFGTSSLNDSQSSIKQKQINKEKIQEIIQLQKQKHEKRIRELEKLAELERLQAEKLKNIMLNDSSLLSNSLFNDLNMKLNSKKQTSNSNVLENLNESIYSDSSDLEVDETNKTGVQVLDLKNTTIRENPIGVLVIKETINNNNFENRRKTEIYRPAKHISPIKTSKRMSLAINTNLKANVGLMNRNFTVKNDKNIGNMSLQEAFETFRCDLISRSRLRQKEIKFRAEQRHQEAELRRLHQAETERRSILKKNKTTTPATAAAVVISERRRMSIQEIKDQNRKLYEKLPEVRQKQMKLKLEEEKRLNRMKSSIFKKSIQQKVLSRGPNFHLTYKAIDDCV